MALFDRRSTTDRLSDVLTQERQVLLEGRITELGPILKAKQRIVDTLVREGVAGQETAGLDQLRTLAERNQALLAAVREGVTAAGNATKDMSTPTSEFVTYDSAGGRKAHDRSAVDLSRRA